MNGTAELRDNVNRESKPTHSENQLHLKLQALQAENTWLKAELAEAQRREGSLEKPSRPLVKAAVRYQALTKGVKDIVYATDIDGVILSLSPAFEHLTGWPVETWIGRHFSLILHPDDIPHILRNFEDRMKGSTHSPVEARIRTRVGSYVVMEIQMATLKEQGEIVELLGVARDITLRKQAEIALKRSENRYRTTIDAMGDIVHVIDREMRIVLYNRAFNRFLKSYGIKAYPKGHNLFELVQILPPSIRQEYRQVFESGRVLVTEESTLVGRAEIRTETRKIPIIDEDGNVNGIVTIVRDVTERHKAEAALKASEERYRVISETISDYVYALRVGADRQISLEWVAGAYASAMGFTPSEVQKIGKWQQLIHPEDLPVIRHHIQVLLSGRPHVEEYRVLSRNAAVRWIRDYGKPVWSDEEHRVTYVYGAAQDITERRLAESALHESEETFRNFVEQSPYGIMMVDEGGAVIEWNQGYEQITGLKREDVLGCPIWEVQYRLRSDSKSVQRLEDLARVKRKTREALARGSAPWMNKLIEDEFCPRGSDGERHVMQTLTFAISTKRGFKLGTIARDVTEQRKMECALRDSEARYRTLFEQASDTILLIDEKDRIIEVNPRACEMFGYSREELLSMTIANLQAPEVRQLPGQIVREEVGRYAGTPFETIDVHRDGARIPVEVSSSWITEKEDRVAISIVRDITARKQAEEALSRRNRELALLNRVIMTAASTLEPVEILEVVCEELVQFLGLPQAAATLFNDDTSKGTVVAEYLSEGGVSALGMTFDLDKVPAASILMKSKEPLYLANAQEDECMGEAREFMRRRGNVSLLILPLIVRNRIAGTIGLDMLSQRSFDKEEISLAQSAVAAAGQALETAELHRELQRHAEHLEDLVAQRTSELERAMERAQSADQAKSQFVSNVSHELRTPLTNIRLYLDLVQRGSSEQRDTYIATLKRETERLQALIEGLLDISRLDLGKTRIRLHPTQINDVVETLAADRKALFAERRLQLDVHTQPELPPVAVDVKLLEQVLTNLLTNALNYTPAEGKTCLTTNYVENREGRWITIGVQDSGPGISEEEQRRLFERFYRGEISRKRQVPGTGLGLAISNEIVKLHGGKLTVASKVNHGSLFTVWLPLDSAKDDIRR